MNADFIKVAAMEFHYRLKLVNGHWVKRDWRDDWADFARCADKAGCFHMFHADGRVERVSMRQGPEL